MARFIIGIIGLIFASALVKFREQVGEMLGEPEWAEKIGGIYNLVVLIGAVIFFWSIAYMTNTMDIFFAPLMNFLPHHQTAGGTGISGADF
jgi:hypothetical protein